MGEDDGRQLVLVVKEVTAVDVCEWDHVFLPFTMWMVGEREGGKGEEEVSK